METLSIEQILSACSKVVENAQELIEEAELLLKNNKHARAFALAHLATEELMKFPMLLPVAYELARNHNVDWKELGKRLTNHIVKIRASILIDFLFQPTQDGVYQAGDLAQQMSVAENINDLKNYSLYTSPIGNKFLKSSERIDPHLATIYVSGAREQLKLIQAFYAVWHTLTGMTEEGVRRFIEVPEFQVVLQAFENSTDLSHFPKVDKQQAMIEIMSMLNDPTFQALLAQFYTIEPILQSWNQAEDSLISHIVANDPNGSSESLESACLDGSEPA